MSSKTFPIEAGHILMFARAIGDSDPIYSDPDYAEISRVRPILAPPTFAQASAHFDPDYPYRPKPDRPWFGSGKKSAGTGHESEVRVGGRRAISELHAEQDFVYHRSLKSGDVLTVTSWPGNTWTKNGKRGGRLQFREGITEYRDQNGELVITARSVSVIIAQPPAADRDEK